MRPVHKTGKPQQAAPGHAGSQSHAADLQKLQKRVTLGFRLRRAGRFQPADCSAAIPQIKVARELTERLEIHYTPKHGTWLNIAEWEFSVLQRQCLDRRIEIAALLGREVNAWEESRNTSDSKINWQFPTDRACTKLRCLYPEYLRQDSDQPSPAPTKVHN